MNVERSTLKRWLEELETADKHLSSIQIYSDQFVIAHARAVASAQRDIWFVQGQLRGLLIDSLSTNDVTDSSHRDRLEEAT